MMNKLERLMLHKFEMLRRRDEQRARQPNVRFNRFSKSDLKEYRNRGMWPKGKTVNAGRSLARG